MNRDDRATVRKAARLLREEGMVTFESCEGNSSAWACGDCKKGPDGKCNAQRHHDDLLGVARKLMALAGKNQRAAA